KIYPLSLQKAVCNRALSSPLPARERIKVRVLIQRANARDSGFRLCSVRMLRQLNLSERSARSAPCHSRAQRRIPDADAQIFETTALQSGRSTVEGAVVGAEKDPGFFAALRMTKTTRSRGGI